jgi:hypothetical protein
MIREYPKMRGTGIPGGVMVSYLEAVRVWAQMSQETLAEGWAEVDAEVEANRRRKEKAAELDARLRELDERQGRDQPLM